MNLPQAAEPSPYSPLAVCLYLSSGSIRQTDAGGYWSLALSTALCYLLGMLAFASALRHYKAPAAT